MLTRILTVTTAKSPTLPLTGINRSFVSKWKTDNAGSSNNDQITLPFESGGTYKCIIDWGDGTKDRITVWNQAETTHTYPSAGTYTVKISGVINGWRFNAGGDDDKILEIKNWGSLLLGNNGDYFSGCSNLVITATDILDTSAMTNWLGFWANCSSIRTIPSINKWDSSNVTNGKNAFASMSLHNQDLDGLDMSKLEDGTGMFTANSIFNGKIGWSLPSLQIASSMFQSCPLFNQIVSRDGNMQSLLKTVAMFLGDSAYNQPLNWFTPNLNDMRVMLFSATAFNQDISGLDVAGVTDMLLLLSGTSFSTANYNLLLVAWEQQALQSNVDFNAGSAMYSGAAIAAKASIESQFSWNILDGGQVP